MYYSIESSYFDSIQYERIYITISSGLRVETTLLEPLALLALGLGSVVLLCVFVFALWIESLIRT